MSDRRLSIIGTAVVATLVLGGCRNPISSSGFTPSVRGPTASDPGSPGIDEGAIPAIVLSRNFFVSALNQITIQGSCVVGNTIHATIDDGYETTPCTTGTFSLALTRTTDGVFVFSIVQEDPWNHVSPPTVVTWSRDTTRPGPPAITSHPSALSSGASSLTVAGTCTSGLRVTLSGADAQSATCSGGVFSFGISRTSDGTYNYTVLQTSITGMDSLPSSMIWIRDTAAPSAPTIAVPASNPHNSSGSSITIAGVCEVGTSVTLSGDATASYSCAAGTYSFNVSEAVNGTYDYGLAQTDPAGNTSSVISFGWIRDSAIPATPTIVSPAASLHYSSSGSITISGACTDGNTVQLAGASPQSVACSSSSYSFTANASTDGTYDYYVTQVNGGGTASAASQVTWIRDSIAPPAPVIANPASNPFTSSDTSFVIAGTCETGSTVTLAGASAGSSICVAGAFSISVSKPSDGIYDFTLSQADSVGNVSPAAAFQWVRDTSIPPTPVIASPASSVHASNGSTLVIAGSCASGNLVTLAGADAQTVDCDASAFSFTVSKGSDGSYVFAVKQTGYTGMDSAQAQLTWVRDTVAPAAPAIESPASSPYYSFGSNLSISGSCESGAMVSLAGADTQTVACAAGAFAFTVSKATDGTYDFTVSQTDSAGNLSASDSQRWVRDSSLPPTPTILSPSTSPHVSNDNSITISGGCVTGNTVTLAGAASDSQPCTGSAYSFTVTKASDATYSFSVAQTSPAFTASGAAAQSWTRDTVAPDTTFGITPPAQNLSDAAGFSFSASEAGVTFWCRLDAGSFESCVSPYALSGLANGSHTLQVQATDSAGNVETAPASYTWTQAVYNTLALYHFDAPGTAVDSSLFTGGYNSALTDSGTASGSSAMFGQSRQFSSSSSQFMSAGHNDAQNLAVTRLTAEAWVNLASLPSNGTRMVIASKTGAAGNYGWSMKLRRQSSSYYLVFAASLDGATAPTEVRSTAIPLTTGAFRHFAVTWDQGTVKFYVNGEQKGTASIGVAGSASIYPSTAPLRLGSDEGGFYLNGTMDECRISQAIRWTGSFAPAASPYAAD